MDEHLHAAARNTRRSSLHRQGPRRVRFQQGGRLRLDTLNSSLGHGAGSIGLDPCQLGNPACVRLLMEVLELICWVSRRVGVPSKAGQGRLGRKVGRPRAGKASRGTGAAVSNRRDGERAAWPVPTKPPHLLNSSLSGHRECSLQLGQYFQSSQFLFCFKGPQRRSEKWAWARSHRAM